MQRITGSSAIDAVERRGDDLRVHFTSGKTYDYAGAGSKADELVQAESAGRFFASEIKDKFEASAAEDEMDVTLDDTLPIG